MRSCESAREKVIEKNQLYILSLSTNSTELPYIPNMGSLCPLSTIFVDVVGFSESSQSKYSQGVGT